MDGPESHEDDDALRREVVTLRARVAELQRAAARHEDTDGPSLAEREELLREAERIAHLGTWTWNPHSGWVTWSDELYRILGFEPGSITPSVETFFAAVHPEDRERARAVAGRTIDDGILPLVDCRVVRPDGSIRHTTSSSSMLFDRAGVTQRVVGGLLDRTESLEVETKLRRTLAWLEEAQRFAQLGTWRLDPSTGELEWSTEFRRIAGLPLDATPSAELFHERMVPEDRERFRTAFVQATQERKGGEIDGRLRRPDGDVRHVRMSGFPVPGGRDGWELRGTMLDITDQVRMREELAHTQKMEAVGRLAAGIAHDFNNLLTVVMANLELLQERFGPADELEGSFQALSSAASLTRRLLAFGRKAHLSLQLTCPNDLVRSTTELMHRLVGDEVELQIDLASDVPKVRVDRVEVERALINLVVNARDAMPGGGVVSIGSHVRQVDGGLQVELTVADRGPGIAEDDRPRIFEPFFTTRGQTGGTGLGLATVLGTAEQHGGTVRVQPRPGGGSIFTLVLPAARVEPDVGRVEAARHGPRRKVGTLRLLVVDDEPDVAKLTRQLLQTRGHVVRVATDPEQALRIWTEHGRSIDLVLCDVVMAQMRGPELVARFAELGPAPRALFITGYSEEAVRSELDHPVLAKPFTAGALWRAIRAAMD